jgi:hypothetical protein
MLPEVSVSAIGNTGESSVVGRMGTFPVELSAVANGWVESNELSPTGMSSYWSVGASLALRSARGNTGVGRVSVVVCAGLLLGGAIYGGAKVVGLCGFVLPAAVGRVLIVGP